MSNHIRKEIDLSQYNRKGMFEVFASKQVPFFSTTFTVDITLFKKYLDAQNLRFFASITHVISEVVNKIPVFRHRIIDGKLYEYERVDPGYTILMNEDEFSFCATTFNVDFNTFYQNLLHDIDKVKEHKDDSNEDRDYMFFISSIPWFSFTSFTHPYDPQNGSIPLITIGKYYLEGNILKLPIAVQVHHGTMDGLHVGKFYNLFQQKLNSFLIK